jgi:hypothetical protein
VDPFVATPPTKKFLAVAGIGLVGLVSLTACTAAGSSENTDTESASEAAAEETTEAAPVVIECDYVPADADPDAGESIEAPLDMCTAGQVDTWDIAITAVEVDATETILETDATNTAPAEGSQYFMVTLTGTNKADAAASPADLLVGVRNESWTYQSDCGLVPNDILEAAEVAPGESFTANRCVPIETDKVKGSIIEIALLNSWEEETYTYFASA